MFISNRCLWLFLVFVFICQLIPAQKLTFPSELLIGEIKLPKICLVGTFHFEYYNADAYKVDKNRQIDILSASKQRKLNSLLDYIACFRPNKIAIEALPDWEANEKYTAYKAGKLLPGRDHRFQIAFRLADKFGLGELFSVDAPALSEEVENNPQLKPVINNIFRDYYFRSNENYKKYYDYLTVLSVKLSLLDYFKYANSPEALTKEYGAYLLGGF